LNAQQAATKHAIPAASTPQVCCGADLAPVGHASQVGRGGGEQPNAALNATTSIAALAAGDPQGIGYRVVRKLTKTSPGSSGVSLRPKYKRLPSPERDARVSEPGVLIEGLSMRCGVDQGALVLVRVAT